MLELPLGAGKPGPMDERRKNGPVPIDPNKKVKKKNVKFVDGSKIVEREDGHVASAIASGNTLGFDLEMLLDQNLFGEGKLAGQDGARADSAPEKEVDRREEAALRYKGAIGQEGETIQEARKATESREPPWRNPNVDALSPQVWKLLCAYSHPDDDAEGVEWQDDKIFIWPDPRIREEDKNPQPGSLVRRKCHKCFRDEEPCVWSASIEGPLRCLRCEEAKFKFCNADGRIPRYWKKMSPTTTTTTTTTTTQCNDTGEEKGTSDQQGKFLLAYYLERLREAKKERRRCFPQAELDFWNIARDEVTYIRDRPILRRLIKLGLLEDTFASAKKQRKKARQSSSENSAKKRRPQSDPGTIEEKEGKAKPFVSTPSQHIIMREFLETRKRLRQLERETDYLADKAARDYLRLFPHNQDDVMKADEEAIRDERSREDHLQDGETIS